MVDSIVMYLTSYDDYASEFITGKADQSVIIITWKKGFGYQTLSKLFHDHILGTQVNLDITSCTFPFIVFLIIFTGVCLSTGGVLHPVGVLHRGGFSIPGGSPSGGGGGFSIGGGGSPSGQCAGVLECILVFLYILVSNLVGKCYKCIFQLSKP